jgi:hypothetical protein
LPPQYEAQVYYYGGISEFQLIRNQLIADGIVQRAAASILEKNSTVFYKVKDFKDLLARNQEGDLIKFFNILENNRSIYGAGMIDAEDDAFVLNQSLTDIDKVDTASIRRLAMVTSIPVAWLVGEDVQGLNASGKVESEQFFWMIKNLRETYCKSPINRLMTIFGKNPIKFKKSNDMTPEALIEYESKAIDNAVKLNSIGEDAQSYLVTKGVLKKDESLALFNGDDDAG